MGRERSKEGEDVWVYVWVRCRTLVRGDEGAVSES